MKMESLMDELISVDWLSRAGQGAANALIFSDASQASQSLASPEWDNFRLMIKNRNAYLVNRNNYSRYQEWNGHAKRARDFFAGNLSQVVTGAIQNVGLSADSITSISWDIVNIVVAAQYSDLLVQNFYLDNIWPVYKIGHIPCGWAGAFIDEKWVSSEDSIPPGKLYVF